MCLQSRSQAMAVSSGSTILTPSAVMLQYYIHETEASKVFFNPLTAKPQHGPAKNVKTYGSTCSCTEKPTILSSKNLQVRGLYHLRAHLFSKHWCVTLHAMYWEKCYINWLTMSFWQWQFKHKHWTNLVDTCVKWTINFLLRWLLLWASGHKILFLKVRS